MVEFINYLSKYIAITLEDVAYLHKNLPTLTLKKNSYLLQNEEHKKSFYFLEKGTVIFTYELENEIKKEIFSQLEFISTYNYQHSNAYNYNIIGLDNTQYVEVSLEKLLLLFNYNPKFKRLPSIMLNQEIVDDYVLDW